MDRHLLALRLLAEAQGRAPHPLFYDPLFGRSGRWRLSTSNLSVPHVTYFGFGAVVEDGYANGLRARAGLPYKC